MSTYTIGQMFTNQQTAYGGISANESGRLWARPALHLGQVGWWDGGILSEWWEFSLRLSELWPAERTIDFLLRSPAFGPRQAGAFRLWEIMIDNLLTPWHTSSHLQSLPSLSYRLITFCFLSRNICFCLYFLIKLETCAVFRALSLYKCIEIDSLSLL